MNSALIVRCRECLQDELVERLPPLLFNAFAHGPGIERLQLPRTSGAHPPPDPLSPAANQSSNLETQHTGRSSLNLFP